MKAQQAFHLPGPPMMPAFNQFASPDSASPFPLATARFLLPAACVRLRRCRFVDSAQSPPFRLVSRLGVGSDADCFVLWRLDPWGYHPQSRIVRKKVKVKVSPNSLSIQTPSCFMVRCGLVLTRLLPRCVLVD